MKKPKKILAFIDRHDENWVFFFVYLALSIILSLFFNIGFFLLLVLVHVLLDFLKHWHSSNRTTNHARHAFLYAMRDGFLFDFVLLLIGFAIGYIFHLTLAVGVSRGVKLASSDAVDTLFRALPRIVAADWVVEKIAILSAYVREHDKRKVYMPPRLTNFEKTLIATGVLLLGIILVLPVATNQSYESLWLYTQREIIPFVSAPH
jgi:hypothetical protein